MDMEFYNKKFAAALYVSRGVFENDRYLRAYLRVGKNEVLNWMINIARKRVMRTLATLSTLSLAAALLTNYQPALVAWAIVVSWFIWAEVW